MRIFHESRLMISQWHELKRNFAIPSQFDLLSINDRICVDYVCSLTGAKVFSTVM